ncbi:hypothetical protein Vretimale_14213 [Volvox reticuliferus]|uniref:Uncharacterized protein n=1 Tax=Volvox reticuliferus TaxID=1737510 RepID=A0A8J4GN79_9CHLO|nr:hypothetical protein Vretifemale_15189 [Volvox reticuliferus]GIM10563.1 hypothetical protein Vretimale_14213 [Volvox reticuliferus]
MACVYGTKYGVPMLLSTTIQEEDEEDVNDFTVASQNFKSASYATENMGAQDDICMESGDCSQRSHRDRRLSKFSIGVVASIATFSKNIINRVFHGQKRDVARGQPHRRSRDGAKNVDTGQANAGIGPAKMAMEICTAGATGHSLKGSCSSLHTKGTAGRGLSGTKWPFREDREKPYGQRQYNDRKHQSHHQPQPPRGSHLVRLMDGDDVRLAMQALQLAAQIHDHVWGPDGAPPCNREALLDAASPLYDTAMAAARAIQHRALHALVKQAVRRYVNPYHGSPDDVLQVILELLTGCGGTAAPKPALTVMTAICNTTAQRCLSDVDSGHRGSVGRAAREQSGSSLLTPLERSSTLFASRSSPNGPHQRVSCGSSLGSSGRLSTPSSLDSNGSDSSLHVTLGMRN